MSKLLKEISESGLPEDFKSELDKSAFHLAYQGRGKSLSVVCISQLDNIMEMKTQADKLSAAERIFSNMDASSPSDKNTNNKNNDTVYL